VGTEYQDENSDISMDCKYKVRKRTESMTPVHVLDFLSKVSIKKIIKKYLMYTHLCRIFYGVLGKTPPKPQMVIAV
jgi:hypothetical protein